MVFTRDYFSNTVLIFNYQLIFEVLRMNKNINKIQNLEYFIRKRKNNYAQKNMERERSISTEKWVKNEYSTSRCNHVNVITFYHYGLSWFIYRQYSYFEPPENIRKSLLFWHFQEGQKWTLRRHRLRIFNNFKILQFPFLF